MFSRIQAFIRKHQRKFIFGGVFIGGAFLISKYGKKMLKDHQEKETRELFEINKKQHYYDCINGIFNITVQQIGTILKKSIIQHFNTEKCISELKTIDDNDPNDIPEKVLIWQKLKILSFAKLISMIYLTTILVVSLRIQLSLIGGYRFRDLVDGKEFTLALQERYISFCKDFVLEGANRLSKLIEEKVNLILGKRTLNEILTISDIEKIFWSVESSVTEDLRNPCKVLAEYILPDQFKTESFETDNKLFDQIIKDTKDLFECSDVSNITLICIHQGFYYLVEVLKKYINGKPSRSEQLIKKNENSSSSEMSENSSISMAKLIPIIDRLIRNKNNVTELWIAELIKADPLEVLGANVYETFSSKC